MTWHRAAVVGLLSCQVVHVHAVSVSVCVHGNIVTSNNIPALLQMEAVAVANFPKYKRSWLDVLLKHNIMPEAEAMRFIRDVVAYGVADNLKREFPGVADMLADEVRLFLYTQIALLVLAWKRGGLTERNTVPCTP